MMGREQFSNLSQRPGDDAAQRDALSHNSEVTVVASNSRVTIAALENSSQEIRYVKVVSCSLSFGETHADGSSWEVFLENPSGSTESFRVAGEGTFNWQFQSALPIPPDYQLSATYDNQDSTNKSPETDVMYFE